jgi:hypothetical protein
MYFMPGNIGTAMRLFGVAAGGYQLGTGVAQASSGNISEGTFNAVLGALQVVGNAGLERMYRSAKFTSVPASGVPAPEVTTLEIPETFRGAVFKDGKLVYEPQIEPPITSGGTTNAASQAAKGGTSAVNRLSNALPENPSQLSHIFRDAPGHLPDTPANRQLLLNTGTKPSNSLGINRFGNDVFVSTRADGSQVWVEIRNGIIQNGGVNNPPRTWIPNEGLR